MSFTTDKCNWATYLNSKINIPKNVCLVSYKAKLSQALFRGGSQQPPSAELEEQKQREKEEKEERDDEETLQRAREMDDWKDSK